MYVVRRSGPESWQENYKSLEDRKICECYVSKKIQEFSRFRENSISRFQNEVFSFLFFLCVFSVFIIFHSHFWHYHLYGRIHISKRRQISMSL